MIRLTPLMIGLSLLGAVAPALAGSGVATASSRRAQDPFALGR